ncbi:MAG: rod shape-determining protein MreC [Actinomycetota bacterium]
MALRSRPRNTRLLVVTLVCVSLLTITLDYKEGDSGPLAGLGRTALSIVAPLQEAVTRLTRPIGDFFSAVTQLPSLRNENERLQDEVAQLQNKGALTSSEIHQLESLKKLLGLKQSLDPPSTAALVIASSVDNSEWSVEINKGSSDGIQENMPVFSGTALMGHVSRVSTNASIVRLIIDPNSKVPARLDDANTTGLLVGQGEEDLKMLGVPSATQVGVGDTVVTSGYRLEGRPTGIDPPGRVIGTVSHVGGGASALEKDITVRPAVDFSTLDDVLVVLSTGSG